MLEAKEKLKDAQFRQRDDEEMKAQELINKLEKSQLEFKKWMVKKEDFIQKKKEKIIQEKNLVREKKEKEKNQKLMATKAFEVGH